jgi:ribosomal protein L3 glutamine methyltransferase
MATTAENDTIRQAAGDLHTLRDFLRYAISRFEAAELSYGHGTTNATDEAAYLILEKLRLPIDQLDPFLDARLLSSERLELAQLIEQRVTTRKPAAYLLKKSYIKGVPFYVDERVIVPRSYLGELLTSELFSGDSGSLMDPDSVDSVLDLCTGSGALAILAAMVFEHANVDAVDVSPDAAEVARRNIAECSEADRIEFLLGDLFAPLTGRTYDLILTNPPYVDAEAMAALPPEYRHEPEIALAGGPDGLDIVRRILKDAPDHLNDGGGLLCEIGTGREILDEEFPDLPFLWLDTEESSGEVFWLPARAFRKS